MKLRWTLALLISGTCLIGCAQGPQGPQTGEITTGSILPALPSAASILPSVSALVPALPSASASQKPERVSGNLYRVPASDRRLDDAIQRENYALLRAAETAKAAGGTHFIVVNASKEGAAAGAAPTTLIRVLRLERGAEPPIGAVAADEIVHFFGPTFGRTAEQAPAPARQG